jgi:hypothetical protein
LCQLPAPPLVVLAGLGPAGYGGYVRFVIAKGK